MYVYIYIQPIIDRCQWVYIRAKCYTSNQNVWSVDLHKGDSEPPSIKPGTAKSAVDQGPTKHGFVWICTKMVGS